MSILEQVIKAVAEETGCDNISEHTFLESLGLDSLGFVSLMLAINKEVAEIPDAEWVNINTVGAIAKTAERYIQ